MIKDVREKYEFLLGFIAIIISLSAFKSEFSQINIELGYVECSLSQYFLAVLIGFLICLYIYVIVYVIENIIGNTRITNSSVIKFITKATLIVFIMILFSPFIILINYGVYKAIVAVGQLNQNTISTITSLSVGIASLLIGLLSRIFVDKYIRFKKEREQDQLQAQEIKELETATKLFQDGYHSQAILEAFKILELHLYRLLTDKDIRVQRQRFNDILRLSVQHEILTSEDVQILEEIREMRNSAAHLNVVHNKDQAEKTMMFVKDLIGRTRGK